MIDYHCLLWWMVMLIFGGVFFVSFFGGRSPCLVLGPVIEVNILMQIVLDLHHHGLGGLRVICGLNFRWGDTEDLPGGAWSDRRLEIQRQRS